MTKEQENEVIDFMEGKDLTQVLSVLLHGLDVSEIINLVILSGRGYSVKLLKFFKWYCQLMPIFIMMFHVACMYVFAQHSKEMGIWYEENMMCYALIYFAVYIHPMIIIPASRFFWLCYRWRIPLIIYFLGVNAVHLVYGNIFTTNDMVQPTWCMLTLTVFFYGYGFVDKWFCGKGKQCLISRIQK